MKAFLICPVRGYDQGQIEPWVKSLEGKGWEVHWPSRDTDQDDPDGYRICCDNRDAITSSDRVFIIWDGKSTGSLFDLGMAFAMNKPITALKLPDLTDHKSFQNMITVWECE